MQQGIEEKEPCPYLFLHLKAVVPRGVVPVELEPLVGEDVDHVSAGRVLHVVGEELVQIVRVNHTSPDPSNEVFSIFWRENKISAERFEIRGSSVRGRQKAATPHRRNATSIR